MAFISIVIHYFYAMSTFVIKKQIKLFIKHSFSIKKCFSIVIKWFLVYLQSGEHQSPENDVKLSDLVEKTVHLLYMRVFVILSM